MRERRLSRPFCTDPDVAERREWLLANGRGGYAMGTVAGTLTRRYHGLLIAALAPPVARRLIVPTVQIEVTCRGTTWQLGSNRWVSGLRAPEGWRYLSGFALRDGVPAWTYDLGDVRLDVALAMTYERDETALALTVIDAPAPVDCTLRVIVADRDHHGGPLPNPASFRVAVAADRATVALPACGRTLHVAVPGAVLVPAGDRWTGFVAEREVERGLDPLDDYLHALDAAFTLEPGAGGGIVLGLEPASYGAPELVEAERVRARAVAAGDDDLLAELAVAANRFIVTEAAGASRTSVIAGYPWFSDWGRDTMIALPGLTLALGRGEIAEAILRSFVPYISGGMLPNVFPDAGAAPEYNTVDAALWFVEAVRACAAVTRDPEFVHDLFPAVRAVVDGYRAGTRFGIGVDPADGLVHAGVPGVQLTWMDAKVGDDVITPRIGKPVEINALWYAALRTAAALAEQCDENPLGFEEAARTVAGSFDRFWHAAGGYAFDVIDGPGGDDGSLRPNQLFAVALAPELFGPERNRAILDACARTLLTPVGLRTLAPDDPHYVGRYAGDQRSRDGAYHQGTVWPWLIGAYVRAQLAIDGDRARARRTLDGLIDALDGYGLGTLGEIFEGDPPHRPVGTIAQAWSVAELIRAYRATV